MGDAGMKSKKILSPKNDYFFKQIFFDESDVDVLKKLIQDCIEFDDKQVDEILLLDRTIDRVHENDKLVIFDVNARLSDGTLVNIEIQKLEQLGFIERTIFYSSKRLTEQGTKGSKYYDLKQTVSLNIVDFNIFKETEDFYSTFYFTEKDRNTLLSKLLRIDFLELKKLNLNKIDVTDKKQLWVKFFNAETEEDLEMITKIDKSFEKPVKKVKILSDDPTILSAYEEREKAKMDEEARILFGIQQGIEQGIEQGLEQGKIQQNLAIAKKLLASGMNDEQILDITGLTNKELSSLKND